MNPRRDLADEQGSTFPLIIGFFLLAMLVVAGSVAAGDAFVQQRGLQDTCDGAALAAAASAVDLSRDAGVPDQGAVRFADVRAPSTPTWPATRPGARCTCRCC